MLTAQRSRNFSKSQNTQNKNEGVSIFGLDSYDDLIAYKNDRRMESFVHNYPKELPSESAFDNPF